MLRKLWSFNRSVTEKKYELIPSDREGLFRIRALRDFGAAKSGEVGGYVQGEHNLSHGGEAWISDKASVSGNASVSGKAQIGGNATIVGNAQVEGAAHVFGNAWVGSYARVSGNARVSDYARVLGNARVGGHEVLGGNDWIEIGVHNGNKDRPTGRGLKLHPFRPG